MKYLPFLWRFPLTTRSQTSVPRSPLPAPRFSNIRFLADAAERGKKRKECFSLVTVFRFRFSLLLLTPETYCTQSGPTHHPTKRTLVSSLPRIDN